MFPVRYFPRRYYADDFFPAIGAAAAAVQAAEATKVISFVHIGYWNRWVKTDECTTGTTVTPSSEATDHDGDQTLSSQLSRTWRSTGLSGQFLSGNLGNAYHIGAVALVKHNLTPAATVRVRISPVANFATTVFDQTWNAWRNMYSATELAKGKIGEFFDTDGIPLQGTIDNILQNPVFFLTFTELTGTYVRFDFTDASNPDGFIEVGAVYVGAMKTLDPNVSYGWQLYRDHIARTPNASNGEIWSGSVFRRTHLVGQVTAQSEADSKDFWFFVSFLRGQTRPIFVIWRDDLNSIRLYGTLWCKFASAPTLTHYAIKRYSIPFEFEELL